MNPPSTLRRLFRYSRPYRSRLAWAVLAMAFYAVGNAGILALVTMVFDQVLQNKGGLTFVVWAIVGLNLIKGIGSYGSSYLMTDVGQRVVMDLRNALYRHILGQSAAFFAQHTTGQLNSRINNDVGQVQQAVSETAGDLARESLALVGFIAYLFYLDPWLAAFCVISAPLIVYPLARLGQRVRKTTRKSQEALEHLSHISVEGFTGHRIVKAFGNEGKEAARFNAAGRQLFRTNMKVTAALASLPPLMEFLGGIGMAVAIWYGSREIARGSLTIGQLTSFVATLFAMYQPAKKLSRVNANLQQAIAASERIFKMLDTHTEVAEKAGAPDLAPFKEGIVFRDVSFGYDENPDSRILRGVTFAAGVNQMIAIVGRSGAGKTTLVNLLPRFYDVTAGSILIDGVDVRDVSLESLRRQIGIVTQDTVLFDDTIASNIAYGAPAASRAEIEAAARAAHAHDFIISIAGGKGYDTTIGERGQRLSGGQRQRLAIARAILRDAPILVLDEATSALDTESELLVQEALHNLMLNRTSFVIAHRLSTIRRADAIVVLERGKIVEIGRHDELVARPNGAYAALYDMQLLEVRKGERKLVTS
ncbi:MAG: ABC transporter ATP-binding protein [Vicinamibacterales bacterium]